MRHFCRCLLSSAVINTKLVPKIMVRWTMSFSYVFLGSQISSPLFFLLPLPLFLSLLSLSSFSPPSLRPTRQVQQANLALRGSLYKKLCWAMRRCCASSTALSQHVWIMSNSRCPSSLGDGAWCKLRICRIVRPPVFVAVSAVQEHEEEICSSHNRGQRSDFPRPKNSTLTEST